MGSKITQYAFLLIVMLITGNNSPLYECSHVTNSECFIYEELPDGTLRITGYDESKNTQNPYQITIPSYIDGKPVSTLGEGCLNSCGYELTELTISEGITTLEGYLLNFGSDIRLVNLSDDVAFIDEKAFYRKIIKDEDEYDYPHSVAIACTDTSYAYEYALQNDFACQIAKPALPENQFLTQYRENGISQYPYLCHYRIAGETYDYIVVEYLDMEIERRLQGEYSSGFNLNEFIILVLDKETNEIYQCIDSSCMDPDKIDLRNLSGVTYKNLLSIADWNFDGTDDLHCYQGYFGTGAASFSSLFAYDISSRSYVNVPSFLGIDSADLREDKKCIYGYSRGGASLHYVYRYEYLDGAFVCVAQLTQTVKENDVVEIIDERKINGKWQVYRKEDFYPRDTSLEEPYLDAYEQAEALYVNDGYWDL